MSPFTRIVCVRSVVRVAALMCAMLASAPAVAGGAVQWRVQDGGNGHWYLASANRMTFSAALAWAQSAGGHLATIGSTEENAFLFNLARATPNAWDVNNGHFGPGPFFGLQQLSTNPDYSEPDGGWRWVTGEALEDGYENFCTNQPDNNNGGGQSVGSFYGGTLYGRDQQLPCWDDIFDATQFSSLPWTFLVEWDADCNGDGVVDYTQCRHGNLADVDADNIPDVCEGMETGYVAVADSYQQFSSTQGQSGWTYWFDGGAGTVPQAMQYFVPAAIIDNTDGWCAEPVFGDGGSYCVLGRSISHTATVESCSSPGALQRPRRLWQSPTPVTGKVSVSGTFRSYAGQRVRIEVYVDGVLRFAKNAVSGTNVDDLERFGASIDVADCTSVEVISDPQDGSCHTDATHYIVRVLAVDSDGDGVPDPRSIRVPQDFPTIQAAIDSVPAGTRALISVAAGTYNESFSLNGKDVVVRGASNNATILDGTGLTTSIARFTGNEPATAGVESLVFRNGTAGSLIYKGAAFDVGGAVYGINSQAFIRNCRFEQCAADYGGAIYLLYCRMNISGCTFDDNTAFDEGGGLFVYETTGPVLNCTFTSNDTSVNGPGAGSAFKAVGARATGEVVELTGCAFTGNRGLLTAAAIEYYENVQSNPGVLRISGCTVTGNQSGTTIPSGAAGLRVLGRNTSCIITGGTEICSNSPKNIAGPFLVEGSATLCECFADVTGDGLVNGGDLGVLLSAWGIALPTGDGDVDHDGMVNATDLSMMLGSWGACP